LGFGEFVMSLRSIQFLALVSLFVAAAAVAFQTTPSNAANACRSPVVAGQASLALAAMFATQIDEAEAPLFSYAATDIALDPDSATLVDVSDVTSCARHKIII